MAMTRGEFRKRWESSDTGDGITFEDVAECAKAWGLYSKPKIVSMPAVLEAVLEEANCEQV
jgi:hypothetical protein